MRSGSSAAAGPTRGTEPRNALARVRRVLFLRTDRLGETILNIPAVASLKAALPGCTLTFMVRSELGPLFEGAPWADRVLPYPDSGGGWLARAWRLARLLRRQRFDLAIVSNPKKELHLAVWLAGIPRRVGYDRKWGGLLTHRLPDGKAVRRLHEVDFNLELVRTLELPTEVPHRWLPAFDRERTEVRQRLGRHRVKAEEDVIVLHPWASTPRKQWPLERFQALIHRLRRDGHARLVLVGGAEERSRAQALLGDGQDVINFVGELTLRELAALLEASSLLVSNDSGPVHLAAAVGTATLVLFGLAATPGGPQRWGPWGAGHTVISRASIGDITVEDVVEALYRHTGWALLNAS